MDRKTILLYNLDDPEVPFTSPSCQGIECVVSQNALELAFQQRYGHIVAFKWFRDGYVVVGFSLGYLVVISTREFLFIRFCICALHLMLDSACRYG